MFLFTGLCDYIMTRALFNKKCALGNYQKMKNEGEWEMGKKRCDRKPETCFPSFVAQLIVLDILNLRVHIYLLGTYYLPFTFDTLIIPIIQISVPLDTHTRAWARTCTPGSSCTTRRSPRGWRTRTGTFPSATRISAPALLYQIWNLNKVIFFVIPRWLLCVQIL